MISTSGGLNPRAVAGSPSVTKLTQSSWTGIRASGRPRAAVRKMLYKNRAFILYDDPLPRKNSFCSVAISSRSQSFVGVPCWGGGLWEGTNVRVGQGEMENPFPPVPTTGHTVTPPPSSPSRQHHIREWMKLSYITSQGTLHKTVVTQPTTPYLTTSPMLEEIR